MSQGRKYYWGTIQCFRNFGVSKKLLNNSGRHDYFLSKIFGIKIPRKIVRNFFVSQNFSGMEKFSAECVCVCVCVCVWGRGWVSRFLVEFVFVLQCRKTS